MSEPRSVGYLVAWPTRPPPTIACCLGRTAQCAVTCPLRPPSTPGVPRTAQYHASICRRTMHCIIPCLQGNALYAADTLCQLRTEGVREDDCSEPLFSRHRNITAASLAPFAAFRLSSRYDCGVLRIVRCNIPNARSCSTSGTQHCQPAPRGPLLPARLLLARSTARPRQNADP